MSDWTDLNLRLESNKNLKKLKLSVDLKQLKQILMTSAFFIIAYLFDFFICHLAVVRCCCCCFWWCCCRCEDGRVVVVVVLIYQLIHIFNRHLTVKTSQSRLPKMFQRTQQMSLLPNIRMRECMGLVEEIVGFFYSSSELMLCRGHNDGGSGGPDVYKETAYICARRVVFVKTKMGLPPLPRSSNSRRWDWAFFHQPLGWAGRRLCCSEKGGGGVWAHFL